MRGFSEGTELVQWLDKDAEGYYTAQLAVGGNLCSPFSFHCSGIIDWDEQRLGVYLEKMARIMVERYGDARYPRAEDDNNANELAIQQEMRV